MTAQHAGLSPERWREFAFSRRVVMIANELHRASKWRGGEDAARRTAALERALALTDLTIAVEPRSGALKELLRFRDCLAEVYLGLPSAASDRVLLRVLLRFDVEASRQIPFVAA